VLTNLRPKVVGIKAQFAKGWRHATPVPTVVCVIQNRTKPVIERYEDALVADEARRFHSTSLSCNFGID